MQLVAASWYEAASKDWHTAQQRSQRLDGDTPAALTIYVPLLLETCTINHQDAPSNHVRGAT